MRSEPEIFDRGRISSTGSSNAPQSVALVAARALVSADGTGSLDVAIGQKALVVDRVDLRGGPFLDQAGLLQALGEMLRQLAVLRAGGAAEEVERQPEASADIALQGVLQVAIAAHVEPRLEGAELGRGAVLVGSADEQNLVALHAPEPGVHIRRQHRAGEIAEMLDAVDVGQGGGDQVTAHHCLCIGGDESAGDSHPFGSALRKVIWGPEFIHTSLSAAAAVQHGPCAAPVGSYILSFDGSMDSCEPTRHAWRASAASSRSPPGAGRD